MSELKLPLTCGDVTLLAVGKLDPTTPGSHDEDYVYPIGFRTSRKHASATNPSSKCLYYSEIVEGPDGKPQFRVTCEDMSEHSYEDSTPNGAWSLVFEAIASCTRRSSRGGGPQVSERKGWDLFGLNSDRIRKILMDIEGVHNCTKLRYNKEKAAREAKERQKQDEEEREERERDKKRSVKVYKNKKKSSEYQQPPKLEELRTGEWRLLEEDMEVIPGGSEEQVAVTQKMPEGEQRQREQLHKIWELAAVQQFLRSFKTALGVSPLTVEDFHTAFLECTSALKVIHLRLMMPAGERKRAPEMAEGDGWLDILRDKLREERDIFDEESQQFEKQKPAWTKFLEKDPMPESMHQYFELSLRQRALILWWLCESLLEGEEEERALNIGNMDWDSSAESLRCEPNAFDKDGNAYWYFEGSSGVLYKEGPPKPGRKAKPPEWEPISRGHEDLADVGSKLLQEGKKRKMPELQEFANWIVETEAPKLLSKEQARERAKSKAALLEMLPRKRSSRVATKEEREKEEEEKKRHREAELAARKYEEEKRRKERERQQLEKARQQELAKVAKEEERQRQFKEAERERRLRKRRRLMAKQAQLNAAAEAAEAAGDEGSEGEWWEVGNHVEVFTDDDWWQAVILKTREKSGVMEIYVAYIGGSEDDNEWLSTTSVRVRPPTDSFWENDDDAEDLDGGTWEGPTQQSIAPQASERKARGAEYNDTGRTQTSREEAVATNGTIGHTKSEAANTDPSVMGQLLAAVTQTQGDVNQAPVSKLESTGEPTCRQEHQPWPNEQEILPDHTNMQCTTSPPKQSSLRNTSVSDKMQLLDQYGNSATALQDIAFGSGEPEAEATVNGTSNGSSYSAVNDAAPV